MENQYFSLYSFAVPVQGKEQSILCNLYNAGYIIIPNFLYEVLTEYSNNTVEEIESIYNDSSNTIRKHFEFLIEKNVGTYTNRLGSFTPMRTEWAEFAIIKSAVVQIDYLEKFNYVDVLQKLINLGCRYLEIWCIHEVYTDELIKLLSNFETTVIRSVDIFFLYNKKMRREIYLKLHEKCSKINNIYVYNAPYNKDYKKNRVYFKQEDLMSEEHNTDIDFDEYIIYSEFFIESMHRNPYYNNKVCVNHEGSIKNCFHHERSFGNIATDDISAVILSEEFQELWFANNDKVLEIKDSPFRYIWMNTHELKNIGNGLYSIVK